MTDPVRFCWCGKPLLYRRDLPQRRGGTNFEFSIGRTKFTASVRRENFRATVTEVFINSSKIDSDVDLTARDAAILISIALQYGIPVDELAKSMGRNPDGLPSSPIGAILDILAREEK